MKLPGEENNPSAIDRTEEEVRQTLEMQKAAEDNKSNGSESDGSRPNSNESEDGKPEARKDQLKAEDPERSEGPKKSKA